MRKETEKPTPKPDGSGVSRRDFLKKSAYSAGVAATAASVLNTARAADDAPDSLASGI